MADEWCRCNVSRHGPCLGCGRPIRFAELRAAYERGVRTERASVIAWLRDPSRCSEHYDDDEERADAIERGEHVDKEGGGDGL